MCIPRETHGDPELSTAAAKRKLEGFIRKMASKLTENNESKASQPSPHYGLLSAEGWLEGSSAIPAPRRKDSSVKRWGTGEKRPISDGLPVQTKLLLSNDLLPYSQKSCRKPGKERQRDLINVM